MSFQLDQITTTEVLQGVLLAFYALNVTAVSIYGIHALWLTFHFFRKRREVPVAPAWSEFAPTPDRVPHVTVQLPLFNERWVADRVIRACCRLDWPREKLEIQVLDDSTDEADRVIVNDTVAAMQAEGHDVSLVRRTNRQGFKAGALEEATRFAKGEFLAIFDADFVPQPDFLNRLVPHFADPKVGMVQGRWGHLNAGQNLLTACQEHFIDGHFAIEQVARNRCGRFINFNGTAGIWRRACVDSVGGWTPRTLTEDLDLSYRAQLANWKFVYDVDTVVPAELPATMDAFKAQQRRWNKGTIEVCRLLLADVWRAELPLGTKLESTIHIGKPVLHFWLVVSAILSFPVSVMGLIPMTANLDGGWMAWWLGMVVVWAAATVANAIFYTVATWSIGKNPVRVLLQLPAMTAVGLGMSLSNAWAVGEALMGKVTGFERTPKTGSRPTAAASCDQRKGRSRRLLIATEIALTAYCFACVTGAVAFQQALAGLPFMVLFAGGFAWATFGDRIAAAWTRFQERRQDAALQPAGA